MASRMSALSNTAGALRGDAVKILDEHTLRLRLSRPDITIIASMAEYPAAIVHPSFSGEDALRQPIGTGPYLPQSFEAGVKGVLVRNDKHLWWGEKIFGPPALDRIEFIDHGTDQTTWIAAAADGEVDLLSDLASDHVALMRGLKGWEQKEVLTAQTVVIRANQSAIVEGSAPYADRRVRKALALAVDNSVCRELGLGEQGVVAENHHICRIHPDYYDIGSPVFDPLHSRELLAQAGMLDFEHELISIEDDWRRKTADAAAAQLRAAGLRVRRTVIPEASFWNGWTKYPFSITNWGHRPLGIQIPKLAYYSGAAWNETGYANPQFDALVDRASSILDVELRREVMREIETTLIDDAVVIQPYWRKQYLFHRNTVVGAQAHPTGEIHLYKLAVR
jgi:peptide/nickel transport system substrate-binding protein